MIFRSGCTVLDLALGGGFRSGTIINLNGIEMSGKTLLTTEIIFNALKDYKNKIKYHFDDAERKYGFITKKIYDGFDIILPPPSWTIEDFDDNFCKFVRKNKNAEALIYILDSLDSVPSEQEIARAEKNAKVRKKVKEVISSEETESDDIKIEKSYELEKQKAIGRFFRMKVKEVRDYNCALFIVSQARMNVGVKFGPTYRRNGGKALDHHAGQIVWLKEVEKYGLPGWYSGVCIHAKVSKNDFGKPFRECYFDIVYDLGIDNVASNLYFLYDYKTKLGKTKKNMLDWDGTEYSLKDLILHIEKNNLEEKLNQRVIEKWNFIEDEISPKNRKLKSVSMEEKCIKNV